MSFLTALLAGAGGYGQGAQQNLQNKQNQQQLTQQEQQIQAENAYRANQTGFEQQRLAMEQQQAKQNQDIYQRSIGIDPATGKPVMLPANLQRIVPHPVGQHYQVTPQDELSHDYAVADWYNRRGFPNLAEVPLDQAKNYITQQTEMAKFKQELLMMGIRNTYDLNRMMQSENASLNHLMASESFQAQQTGRHEDFQAWQSDVRGALQQVQESRRELHSVDMAVTTGYAKLNAANTAASQGKTTKDANGNVVPINQVNPGMGIYSRTINQILSKVRQDPSLADKYINGISQNKNLSQDQIDTAVDLIGRMAQSAQQYQEDERNYNDYKNNRPSNDYGASNDNGNPSGAALPPAQIRQMLLDNGATPQEALNLTAIALAESHGDPSRVNQRDPLGNGKFQHAWGLFQLGNGTNDPNAYPGWQDPEQNIQYALQKYRARGYHPWGTYNTGEYKKFLGEAGE